MDYSNYINILLPFCRNTHTISVITLPPLGGASAASVRRLNTVYYLQFLYVF